MVAAANGILFQSSVYSSHSNLPPLPSPFTVHLLCPLSTVAVFVRIHSPSVFPCNVYTPRCIGS